jgi:hypothetical protein
MELYEHRIIKGLLTELPTVGDPDAAARLLARDVQIVVDEARLTPTDLWPALWSLASALERQFTGRIFIRSLGASHLSSPVRLGPRCIFDPDQHRGSLEIGLGIPSGTWGDARGNQVTWGVSATGLAGAHPAASFALAGFLAFAALAQATGIPPHRASFATNSLTLPLPIEPRLPRDGVTLIGLGHLGQAFLSLLYYLPRTSTFPVVLVDRDRFTKPNYNTQILLTEGDDWPGELKAERLAAVARRAGLNARPLVTEINWGWSRPADHPPTALLGLDDLDVRRMAIAAGYEWLVEAGLGTSLLRPRVTWHALPPDNDLARTLFSEARRDIVTAPKPFFDSLKATPGACGWLTFQGISASAPAMGLVAAALAISELLSFEARTMVDGAALLHSPLIAPRRSMIHAGSTEVTLT